MTGSFDKTARVWCSRTGHCLATMWGHDAEVVVAKFSPTRGKLATGSIDATSKIFHVETGIENIAMLSHIIKRAPRFDRARTRSIGRNVPARRIHFARARACKQYAKAVNAFLYTARISPCPIIAGSALSRGMLDALIRRARRKLTELFRTHGRPSEKRFRQFKIINEILTAVD